MDMFKQLLIGVVATLMTGLNQAEPDRALACGDPATRIAQIQGSGPVSPLLGQDVTVEAVVTLDLQAENEMAGFFLQQDPTDDNANTSEGIFVYHSRTEVEVGDRVRLSGRVNEYFGVTQLHRLSTLVRCASNRPLPRVTELSLPLPEPESLEATEGMRVRFPARLTVNDVAKLGRYGEFTLSQGRRSIPTDSARPGRAADAIDHANRLNQLVVDDGSTRQNPDPVRFPAPALTAANSLRNGSTVQHLTGVIHFAFKTYRLIPTSPPGFQLDNPRRAAPLAMANSDLRIASFNVRNYFNGDGLGGGWPTPRGASNSAELARQTSKLLAALVAIDADIVALMELENDGFSARSALASLRRALNAQLPAGRHYQLIDPGLDRIGSDAIGVGLLYRPNRVQPINRARLLTSANSPNDTSGRALFNDALNRPALAQTFSHPSSNERLTLVVTHLKSKAESRCDKWDDCDRGQGAYNLSRTRASQALNLWLKTDPTDSRAAEVMIIGDFNAYSQEDPIIGLIDTGFTALQPPGGYSYVYQGQSGRLDHALASPALAGKLLLAQEWHINSDEPPVLDYHREYKSAEQINTYFAPDPFRSSDHDPLVLDFRLSAPAQDQ
jgi:predicted extracellular nuclease